LIYCQECFSKCICWQYCDSMGYVCG